MEVLAALSLPEIKTDLYLEAPQQQIGIMNQRTELS